MSTIVKRECYLPPYRLPTAAISEQWGGGTSGVQTKAVQAVDDDTVTLGIRVAREVLDGDTDVDAVVFATTTPAYQYGTATPLLCEALGLSAETHTVTLTESVRAGTAAIGIAHDLADAHDGLALVVAAEAPRPDPGTDREKTAGAGGGAVLVDGSDAEDDGFTRVAQATNTRSVMEEWQAPDERERHVADDRFARDWGYLAGIENAVDEVLTEADWDVTDVDGLVVHQPNPQFVSKLQRRLGIDDDVITAPTFAREHGDLGTASALAVLSQVEADAGDRIVLASYGSGVADAIAYEPVGSVPGGSPSNSDGETDMDYVEYLHATENLRRST